MNEIFLTIIARKNMMNSFISKRLNLTIAVASSLLMACNAPTPPKEEINIEKKVETTEKNKLSESDCQSDQHISLGAAKMMEKTYQTALQEWPNFNGDSSLARVFTEQNINSLKDLCEGCNGIRAYLGYSSGDVIPSSPKLLLVNTMDCDADFTDNVPTVLLSNGEGGDNELISGEDAAEMTENWRNAIAQDWENSNSGWAYDSIYAYTFKRNSFDRGENASDSLLVAFTMFVDETKQDNIDLFGTLRLGLMIKELSAAGIETYNNVDIAVRCPTSCGEDNILLPD